MIKTNSEFKKELDDLLIMFYDQDSVMDIVHEEMRAGKLFEIFKCHGKTFEYEYDDPTGSELRQKSLRKRYALLSLYKMLVKMEGRTLPWGSFTGIRPTALARTGIESGETKQHTVTEFLEKEFMISNEKAVLVSKILKNQKGIIRNDHLIDFYVNIPICPSRCLYCSFISNELKQVKNLVEPYIDCVIKEIKAMKKLIFDKALIVRTIYIGGGTPSVLEPSQLDRLLDELTFPVNEFTVECGRPETITKEKLDVLEKHGVTRICINPQTFSDATLKRIGRLHKKADVFNAYALAIEKGFKVNMDFIVGLPGEKAGTITKTLSTLLDLAPNNITLHTLSLKRGSALFENHEQLGFKNLNKVISKCESDLMNAGYKPYYLYRQKYQLGGLENVGFFRDEDLCQFNIDSMEETASIIAVGANAITKRVFSIENRIEREPNVKFIKDYIERVDEMIERKIKLFENV